VSAFAGLSSLDLQRIWNSVHGRVVHGERITLGVFELDQDTHHTEHHHQKLHVGSCLPGALGFRVGDESRELGPGDTWSIPGNVPHEVQVGPEGAVVIDVFVPTRDDWREAERIGQREPRWP
jgi:quercetin dioxygenase-like cupin family protein